MFHALRDPSSGEYVVQLDISLQGNLDAQTLQKAWLAVINQHEILRSSIHWEGLEEPLQCVHQESSAQWLLEDWRGLDAEEQNQRWQQLLAADRQRGFDLTQAPLIRFALCRVQEENCKLLITNHHIVLDGWSLPIVIQTFLAAYEKISRGETVTVTSSARQYRDYIAWLKQQDQVRSKEYWQSLFAGFEGTPALSIRKHAKADVVPIHKETKLIFSKELQHALKKFSHEHGLTLASILQAMWGYIACRYSGSNDIAFGNTVSGRTASVPGIEKLVGLFINTIPVRVNLNNHESVIDYLKRAQKQLLSSQQYDYAALWEIQSWSGLPANQPLFDHIFVFENYPVEAAKETSATQGWKITDLKVHEQVNYEFAIIAGRVIVYL